MAVTRRFVTSCDGELTRHTLAHVTWHVTRRDRPGGGEGGTEDISSSDLPLDRLEYKQL